MPAISHSNKNMAVMFFYIYFSTWGYHGIGQDFDNYVE